MSSQAFPVLRRLVLPNRYLFALGTRPFEWALAVLGGIALSFLLTGCSKSGPSTSKAGAPGSTSVQGAPATQLSDQPQSVDGPSRGTSGEKLKRRSTGRKVPSAADTGSKPKLRRPFTPSEIEAAGRVYAKVQEKRERLLAREDSVEKKTENPTSKGSPASGLPSQMPQMQKQMIRTMASAIAEESELSPLRFRRLMNRAMRDSLLRDRFFEAIQQAGGTSPSPQEPLLQERSP